MHRIMIKIYLLVSISTVYSMHIGLPQTDIGIGGLFRYAPQIGHILASLAETLLRENSPLTRSDRELIAAYVSYLNACEFCCNSHSAAAACLLQNNNALVEMVKQDPSSAPISNKLKILLHIAKAVQKNGKLVTPKLITQAYSCGATEREIHDTVLIASAFCMFNRYVDGLAAWTPTDSMLYQEIGETIATQGYMKVFKKDYEGTVLSWHDAGNLIAELEKL